MERVSGSVSVTAMVYRLRYTPGCYPVAELFHFVTVATSQQQFARVQSRNLWLPRKERERGQENHSTPEISDLLTT